MRMKGGLLRWLFREALPVTLVAASVACLYLLFAKEPIERWHNAPALFIAGHCLMLTAYLGRWRRGSFAFRYTRGTSRDSLWVHTMLATVLAVLAVWIPASLIIWAPVRSFVQDTLLQSPYFPVVAPREARVPFVWLAHYALFLSLFHYAWIRWSQPTRGRYGGFLLSGVVMIFVIRIPLIHAFIPAFRRLPLALGGVVALITLVAGFRLHRRLEVQT